MSMSLRLTVPAPLLLGLSIAIAARAAEPAGATPLSSHGAADFAGAAQDARKLQVPAGFRLDVWAAEPLLANGVAFGFDDAGRCYVAESHRWANSIFDITQKTNWLLADMSFRTVDDRAAFLTREYATNLTVLTRDSEVVRRVEDRDGDGRAETSSVFADGFNSVADGTAAGVLATGSDVWFANIPNLWKLGADGRRRESVGQGFGVHIGVSGHDLHGLIRGPDGRIYASFGDRGMHVVTREGVTIDVPDCGGVVRCEPDGRNLELFCRGLRNPQELAFDDLGNLWTVDNDTAGADPCRVLHLVEGGDYGWRTSYQHMEGFGPWVQETLWKGGQDATLPLAGTVSQGPSGLAYYPGTGFGDRLKGRFLHCDFPGGVVEFTVKPQGATYVVDLREKFLWNCWPTDVDFGPDGALYVIDWVAGWGRPQKGRIYRMAPTDASAVDLQRLLREGMSQRTESELVGLLPHTDRRIRLAAQWALASRGTVSLAALAELARTNRATLPRLHALWGISQLFENGGLDGVSSSAVALAPLLGITTDPDPEVRGQAARLLASMGLMNFWPDLPRLLKDPEPRVRLLTGLGIVSGRRKAGLWTPDRMAKLAEKLTLAAIQLKAPREVWEPLANATHRAPAFPIDSFLEAAAAVGEDDAFGLHPFIAFLADTGSPNSGVDSLGWISRAAAHHSSQTRLAALLAWRRLGNPQLTNFLADTDPRLRIEAARAIHDAPIPAGFPALASFITKVDCPAGLHSRVIDTCFRLGTQQHAQMLAGFATRRDVPESSRVLALKALGDWERPGPLDRVNGLWRPLVVNAARAAAATEPAATAPTDNPLLQRAAQAQAARNSGRAAELPVLPADLGRSAPFEEAMALRRNPAPAQRAFLRVAGELLYPNTPSEAGVVLPGKDSAPIQLALIDTAVRLRTKEASTPLFEKFTASNALPEVRRAIVPALAALHAATASEAVRLALADADAGVRASAIPHLDRLEGDEGHRLLLGLASDEKGDLEARQSAWKSLAERLKDRPARSTGTAEATTATLVAALDRLNAGTLPEGLQLDVLEAAEASGDGGVQARLADWRKQADPGDRLAAYRGVLAGGTVSNGRRIFFDKPETQCSRCHAVGGAGGTVGPSLDGLGKRSKASEILESILSPNARLSPGFENVVLTLKNGTVVAGAIKSEAGGELKILAGEDGEVTVKSADVESRERGLSAMPEGMGALLGRRELRDLVAFLGSLR